MALTKCEKCGGEVSEETYTCPACGASLPSASPGSVSRQPATRKSRGLVFALVGGCLVMAAIVAIMIVTREPVLSSGEPVVESIDLEGTKAKAERGDADAQKNLGSAYAKGLSVKQDYAQAAKWYRLAADQGHAGAQAALGELYEVGQGVPRDESEAAKWYRRAAEQGHAPAQYSLAVLYVMGKGVSQDTKEALKWYRQAAEQGDSLAQFNLGMRYYEGNGVTPDPVEAYQWLSLAAAQKIPDAVKARDALKGRMNREQIAEGKRRTDAFAAKKPLPPNK